MKDLVSIIIPVYNVEQYLEKSVMSVIQQTYPYFEVILVDDGSTDRSAALCHELASQHAQIRVVHKENGGLSSARNEGLKFATGEYIVFLDSDDYVDEDYVSYLYDLIQTHQVLLSGCDLYKVFDGKITNVGNDEVSVMTGKEAIERMCYHDLVDTSANAKMYHRSLIPYLHFPEGKLFEDIGTLYKVWLNCDKMAYGHKSKYYYNIRQNSIVTSSFNPKKMELLEMTDQMATAVTKQYPDLAEAVSRRQLYADFSTLNQLTNTKRHEFTQEKQLVMQRIRKHRKGKFFAKRVPVRDKIALMSLALGIDVYKAAWAMYHRLFK